MHKQIFVDNYVLIHDPNFSLHSSARNTNNKEIYFIFLDLLNPDSGEWAKVDPLNVGIKTFTMLGAFTALYCVHAS